VSLLPVQFSPASFRHWKTGNSISPEASVTIRWRMKVPGTSISVCGAPKVLPPSAEMRRLTTEVSWLPEICEV
jgi:hypothetical protein